MNLSRFTNPVREPADPDHAAEIAAELAVGAQDQQVDRPIVVRRCLWCEAAKGAASFFVDGEWIAVHSPFHLFGHCEFTDGICPECFAEQTRKHQQKESK
jgi:hypothetical protein